MIFLCELTSVIPRLPCLFRMAKAVSSPVELVNSVTSNWVNLFNFGMWAYASKCFPIELVPCSDEWRKSWWQTIHMIPGLLVSSIPQFKENHHEDTCLEQVQVVRRFEPTFIEAHKALNMICKVRSLKSWIKTCSYLKKIITSSKKVFKNFESNMALVIRQQGNPTRETAKSNVTFNQTADSSILTLEWEVQESDQWDIACIFVKLYKRTDWKDWPRKTRFTNSILQFIAVYRTEPPETLLTLRGCWIVGGGCDIVTTISANTGCQ